MREQPTGPHGRGPAAACAHVVTGRIAANVEPHDESEMRTARLGRRALIPISSPARTLKTRLTKILAGLAALTALALGGAAIAGATRGGSDEPEQTLEGADVDRASAAALKATGGGTVNEVERDSEKGASYEVEVRKPDGSTVDVRLDASLEVVAIDSDSGRASRRVVRLTSLPAKGG